MTLTRPRGPRPPPPRGAPSFRPPAVGVLLPTLLVALLLPHPAPGQVAAPDDEWRTFRTERFRVVHPPELEEVAFRAAELAEDIHGRLQEAYTISPSGTIELVVTDHQDVSNGFASTHPWNRVVIFARPPVDQLGLSHFDEWLELVITHELAHLFHLDRTGSLGAALRSVFGRVRLAWPAFPGHSMPTVAIEGIATYYESAVTGSGRLHGTFHDMILRTAALEGRLEGFDQVMGSSPVWPAGDRPYAYGSHFVGYLVARHGPDAVEAFTEAVAEQWIPYRIDAAAREAFGVPLSREWEVWREEVVARSRALVDSLEALAPLTRGERLTDGARFAMHPRFRPAVQSPGPSGGGGVERVEDDAELAYVRSDGRSDPRIVSLRLPGEGAGGGAVRDLAVVNRPGPFSWAGPDTLLFADLDFVDRFRSRSDLHRAVRGDRDRLTRGARVAHADVRPGGEVAVAVREGGGSNELVRVDLSSGEIRPLGVADPDEHWALPRWSPDGQWIAVVRWSAGGRYELRVLDEEGRAWGSITSDRGFDLAPAWSPDGRWILWSSDRTGIPNIYAAAFDPEGEGAVGAVRQVTNVAGGAIHPAVDPDGRWIVYSSYTSRGWELERIAFDPDGWHDPFPAAPLLAGTAERGASERRGERATEGAGVADRSGPPERYRSLPTLLPRWWEPRLGGEERVLGTRVVPAFFGAGTGGQDVVGRHTWELELGARPGGGLTRMEGRLTWLFQGLGNPGLFLDLSREHEALSPTVARPEGAPPDTLFPLLREDAAEVGAIVERRRFRRVARATGAVATVRRHATLLEADGRQTTRYQLSNPRRSLLEGRVGLGLSNARAHAFSAGPQVGGSLSLGARLRREPGVEAEDRGVPGRDASFSQGTGVVRLYRALPWGTYAPAVVAVRASGGVAGGSGAGPRHFLVGDDHRGDAVLAGTPLGTSRELLFPVRGYRRGARAGNTAWSATAEVRVPLAVVHRGAGTFPLHLDRVELAVFADAGDAWGPVGEEWPDDNPRRGPLATVGAELLGKALPFWSTTLDLRFGGGLNLVDEVRAFAYLKGGRTF